MTLLKRRSRQRGDDDLQLRMTGLMRYGDELAAEYDLGHTPGEVERVEQDHRPERVEQIIDQALAGPLTTEAKQLLHRRVSGPFDTSSWMPRPPADANTA